MNMSKLTQCWDSYRRFWGAAVCLATLGLGTIASPSRAQVYEPGSTVLGNTIGDWSKDYRALRFTHDPTQLATVNGQIDLDSACGIAAH